MDCELVTGVSFHGAGLHHGSVRSAILINRDIPFHLADLCAELPLFPGNEAQRRPTDNILSPMASDPTAATSPRSMRLEHAVGCGGQRRLPGRRGPIRHGNRGLSETMGPGRRHRNRGGTHEPNPYVFAYYHGRRLVWAWLDGPDHRERLRRLLTEQLHPAALPEPIPATAEDRLRTFDATRSQRPGGIDFAALPNRGSIWPHLPHLHLLTHLVHLQLPLHDAILGAVGLIFCLLSQLGGLIGLILRRLGTLIGLVGLALRLLRLVLRPIGLALCLLGLVLRLNRLLTCLLGLLNGLVGIVLRDLGLVLDLTRLLLRLTGKVLRLLGVLPSALQLLPRLVEAHPQHLVALRLLDVVAVGDSSGFLCHLSFPSCDVNGQTLDEPDGAGAILAHPRPPTATSRSRTRYGMATA